MLVVLVPATLARLVLIVVRLAVVATVVTVLRNIAAVALALALVFATLAVALNDRLSGAFRGLRGVTDAAERSERNEDKPGCDDRSEYPPRSRGIPDPARPDLGRRFPDELVLRFDAQASKPILETMILPLTEEPVTSASLDANSPSLSVLLAGRVETLQVGHSPVRGLARRARKEIGNVLRAYDLLLGTLAF